MSDVEVGYAIEEAVARWWEHPEHPLTEVICAALSLPLDTPLSRIHVIQDGEAVIREKRRGEEAELARKYVIVRSDLPPVAQHKCLVDGTEGFTPCLWQWTRPARHLHSCSAPDRHAMEHRCICGELYPS